MIRRKDGISMKKLIAMILACLMLVTLVSCRDNENDPQDETTVAPTGSTAPEEEKDTTDNDAPVPIVTDETTETPENGTDTLTEPETEPKTEPATEAETEPVTDSVTEPAEKIDEMTAVKLAREYLGETDPDTGYAYSYQFEEITAEGDYKIKVSWYLEEDERFSTCGYLLVSPDGTITKFDW